MKTVVATILVILFAGVAYGQETYDYDSWYFSAGEIKLAYRYQQLYGERLRSPVRAKDCLFSQKQFLASYQGKQFPASCRFINETIRHIREMLNIGAARYLFPLDADHAHLAIPVDLWETKYRWLPIDKLLPALLEEPTLAALYHTAEHLAIGEGDSREDNEEVKKWKEKRNVLGFYDGRPVEILPPHPQGFGVEAPKTYYTLGGFNFLANPQGELFLFLDGKSIVFDISFDIGVAAHSPDTFPKAGVN